MATDNYTLNLRTEAAQKEVSDAIFASEREALEAALADARALSPRVTGKNADSLFVRLRHTTKGATGLIAGASGYSGWIEIGTKKMKARPYLYPAAVSNLPNIPNAIRLRIGYSTVK